MARTQKKNKKTLLALLILLIAVVIIIGTSLAFFTDIISGSIGGKAGTLDLVQSTITSKQYYTIAGNAFSQTLNTNNINPGDYILIDFNATNAGNKSAWTRVVLSAITVTLDTNIQTYNSFTMTNPQAAAFFTLYKAPTTEELALIDGGAYATLDDYLKAIADGTAVTGLTAATPGGQTPVILNGTGTGAETETSGVTNVPVQYIVYFDKTAGNELQGATVSFGIEVQAMQYRNNGTPNWSTVTTNEFTLTAPGP